jgi:hypothetical protein
MFLKNADVHVRSDVNSDVFADRGKCQFRNESYKPACYTTYEHPKCPLINVVSELGFGDERIKHGKLTMLHNSSESWTNHTFNNLHKESYDYIHNRFVVNRKLFLKCTFLFLGICNWVESFLNLFILLPKYLVSSFHLKIGNFLLLQFLFLI